MPCESLALPLVPNSNQRIASRAPSQAFSVSFCFFLGSFSFGLCPESKLADSFTNSFVRFWIPFTRKLIRYRFRRV
jgi:hypothetical protein